jgi:hypothetical protein
MQPGRRQQRSSSLDTHSGLSVYLAARELDLEFSLFDLRPFVWGFRNTTWQEAAGHQGHHGKDTQAGH